MKNITTSRFTFESLRRDDLLYVDKTMYIYKMLTDPDGQFFLSRPRRFGKSLMVSTLDSIFQGRRDLFRGLYMDSVEYDWETYPVIHIDFAGIEKSSLEVFAEDLHSTLCEIASKYGVLLENPRPAGAFKELIKKLDTKYGKGVVILIDEYDKPMLDVIEDGVKAEDVRNFMDSFYEMIKTSESRLRFVFVTGITKFSKVSMFSTLNNLTDLSMSSDYACMFGYTQDELEDNFSEWIDKVVQSGVRGVGERTLDREETVSEIKRWYDGLRFSPDAPTVYNPVSVGRFFKEGGKFMNYWFSTGSPKYLVKLLRQNHLMLSNVAGATLASTSFEMFDISELTDDVIDDDRIYQLLYQSGYLTLGERVPMSMDECTLRFPNYEVESSFDDLLSKLYVPSVARSSLRNARKAAVEGRTSDMIDAMKTYIADIPTTLHGDRESYFHTVIHCMVEGYRASHGFGEPDERRTYRWSPVGWKPSIRD